MKIRLIFLISFIVITISSIAQDFKPLNYETPLCNMNKGVKEITQKSKSKWNTKYKYDIDGLLIEQDNYYKKEPRAKYRNTYRVVGDSLLTVSENEILREDTRKIVKKFYFNKDNLHYTRFEIFSDNRGVSKRIVIGHNFIYQDSLLESYVRNADTLKYVYNDKQQIAERHILSKEDIVSTEYKYDNKGRLTDLITISNSRKPVDSTNLVNTFLGGVTYSKSQRNKYHYRYTSFDKNGNWRKNYYVTSKGLILNSKRNISYW